MALVLLFVLSIPTVTPYLRGDGNGYYAWLRSAAIDHDLQFANEYHHADPNFQRVMFDDQGQVRADKRTSTDHVDDHWGVGAAVMWAPFFLVAHGFVSALRLVGIHHWQADGFSLPYRWACGFGTALYAFLSLLIAYRIARRRLSGAAAMVGVVAVWGASSLVVYQYLLPFWPFGAASFVGAVLLWMWDSERPPTAWRWLAMGALTGLAFTIHPVAAGWGVLPLLAVLQLRGSLVSKARAAALVGIGVPIGAAPQLIGKAIVYGSPFNTGYDVGLHNPQLFRIFFGANHGLFTWTPIVLIAVFGLAVPLWRRDTRLAVALLGVFVAMVVFVAFFQLYEQSSFGSRFFVAFTPGFVIGAAAVYEAVRARWRALALCVVAVAVVWNALFAFQWAWGLTPKQGSVDWGRVVRNQFNKAPREFVTATKQFVTNRPALIHHVQQVDLERRRSGNP